MQAKLKEGEQRVTPLPPPNVEMVEEVTFGIHFLKIMVLGVEKVKVAVKDYPSWERCFDVAMDKAGY